MTNGAANHFPAKNPTLHADEAEVSFRLAEAIVHIRTQRVERNTTLDVVLALRNLVPAKPTRHHHLATLGTGPHGVLHGTLHRLTIRSASLDLRRNALGDELPVEFRPTHFLNLNLRRTAEQLLQVRRKPFYFRASPSDDNSGPRGVDVDCEPSRIPSLDGNA